MSSSGRSSSPDSHTDGSAGGGGFPADERKRKRMLSNRESARRSRARKQQRLEELVAEVARLQAENAQGRASIAPFDREFSKVDGENAVLRARHGELAGRLESLTSVLEVFQMAGAPVDIPEIPDPLLRPWQPPFPLQPIAADSAFQY
ncbi:hypothetical protein PR202_gb25003 [Eleusine coracana subsp. coracana]|uniref:BZIP domain-containing protein n=1 Tax=Eleusine coracana subsp. coracana TaxID=191504 RepID=A0AAV5FK46_ELECO|nr:hypothetical protein PR202_gb25003 [Eleusine coracana subsp. coracana]